MPKLRLLLTAEVDNPPSQPVGSRFEPHLRPLPAKLPSFGGYSLETLPYLLLTGSKHLTALLEVVLVFCL